MRPERLEVEGFTAFRSPVAIDFLDADLFALTGATGAGKSSIIDAICFALYGSVPRYRAKNLVGPVISQGGLEARVRLDFTVADERYTAVRVVRMLKASASTKEARLVSADGNVLAGNADELTAEVERLLGMSFDHFTTCVVLPQGDFARFLHEAPAKRGDLLVKLLDFGVYERMMSMARQRAMSASGELTMIERQLGQYEFANPAARKQLEDEVTVLSKLLDSVDLEGGRLDELQRQIIESRLKATTAREQVVLLAAIEIPTAISAIGDDIEAAREKLALAETAEQKASSAVARAEETLARCRPRAELDALVAAHTERAKESSRIEQGERVVEAAREEVAVARSAFDEAERALVDAGAMLQSAMRADRAQEFVVALEVGSACPICQQTVNELPNHVSADIKKLQKQMKATTTAAEKAASALAHATGALKQADGLLSEVRRRVAELDQRLTGVATAEELSSLINEVDAAENELKQARSAERESRDVHKRAREALDSVAKLEASARSIFDQKRDLVAALGPPIPARVDLAADWVDLADWASKLCKQCELATDLADNQAAEAEIKQASLQHELQQALTQAGVIVDVGRRIRDVVVDHLASARADLESVIAAIESVEQLREQHLQCAGTHDVASALATQLDAKHFEKWVLDDALRRLVAGATGILFNLSEGSYSLTLDKQSNFCVVDHGNVDLVRSARTLSGGETFLASLALALALADDVAQVSVSGAARIESIFLDEGFGTLDTDTLDVVATAIEELGAQGRMVGVISHVPELAERLPVRFEVTKVGNTSTVTRFDA